MSKVDLIITPDTKVGAVLESYPELEDLLISMSPSFKKLKNLILRKTVAKVATLGQVAKVGNIPMAKLVNELRNAVGRESKAFYNTHGQDHTEAPEWFNKSKIVQTIDARPVIESGKQPINTVFSALKKLENKNILVLITPFNPMSTFHLPNPVLQPILFPTLTTATPIPGLGRAT